MNINYNRSGSERKKLVAALTVITGEKAKYQGAPNFEYKVGDITVDASGVLTIPNEKTVAIIRALREAGFEAVDPLEEAYEEEETINLTVSIPRKVLSDEAIERLKKIVSGKGKLIKKALSAEDLPIIVKEKTVDFPWIHGEANPDEFNAYSNFIARLAKMAVEQRKVTLTEKETDNEKYTFRCFLLRLGFIGDEFKTQRKVLLRNFTGSSAFRKEAQ